MQHGLDPRDVFPCDSSISNVPSFKQYFDSSGNAVSREDFSSNEDWESQIEFIVLPTGDCVSTAYGEWSVVAFEDEETKREELTLAQPKKIYRHCGKWVVEYKWIKSDRACDATQDKHGDVRDIFIDDEDDETLLSLQSYQGSLRLYNPAQLSLPSYAKTSDMLRRWCRGRVHQQIGFWTAHDRKNPNFVGIDVYDVLELFYAQPQLIGRTRIGEWMWQQVLQPLVTNNENFQLVQRLLSADHMSAPIKCEQGKQCVWCGAEALVRVECYPHGELFADPLCLSKIQRFVAVGCFIRVLRQHKQFSPQCVAYTHNFVAQLI